MHQMQVVQREPAGFWRFNCSECDRVLLFRPIPNKTIIVVKGDENEPHMGSTLSGVLANDMEITQNLPDKDKAWLEEQGIAWDEAP